MEGPEGGGLLRFYVTLMREDKELGPTHGEGFGSVLRPHSRIHVESDWAV